MRRLICLLLLGAALAPVPGLGQVAAVSPALSSLPIDRSGCSPISPCAVATPALGNVSLPAPEAPPQPNLPASTEAAAPAAAAGNRGAAQATNANCPPAGARGGFARGGQGGQFARGQFGGRGGEGRGFAGRGGEGRGFGGADASGRGRQFAQNGRGFARGPDGCPRPAGAPGRGPAPQ